MGDLATTLLSRPYPGRGCIAARLGDGTLYFAYFLTGRSDASRKRALEVRRNGDVAVVDTSGSGKSDALRHYLAAATRGPWSVLGNGDQVEPLAISLAAGADPVTAWSSHTYEPDSPIYTPRIWLAVESDKDQVLVGSARRSDRPAGSADRIVWMPESIPVSSGVAITTYSGTADNVVSSALPIDVTTEAATGAYLLDVIWDALDPSLRVAAIAMRPRDPASIVVRCAT